MKPIRVIINNLDGYEVISSYLVTDEVSLIFYNRCIWLAMVERKENELFEVKSPMSLLGEAKETSNDYAKKIIKLLQSTSLFDYIVQKHFYDDQDINWNVTGV